MSNIIYDANFNGPEAVPFIGEAEKYHYVYLIVNTLNQKLYIGVHSTKKLNDGYMSSSNYVHEDIKLLGIENFKKYNLFYFHTRKEALDKEKELANREFCVREDTYNINMGGSGIHLACVPEETRRKMSLSAMGENNPMHGKIFTEEERKRMSERMKGKNNPMYGRPSPNKGKRHSKESIEKMRQAKLGHTVSQETRDKIADKLRGHEGPNKGIKFSEEWRKNLSKSHIGIIPSCAIPIEKYDVNGNLIKSFASLADAAKDAGFARGGTLKKYVDKCIPINGFYYRYKEENNN